MLKRQRRLGILDLRELLPVLPLLDPVPRHRHHLEPQQALSGQRGQHPVVHSEHQLQDPPLLDPLPLRRPHLVVEEEVSAAVLEQQLPRPLLGLSLLHQLQHLLAGTKVSKAVVSGVRGTIQEFASILQKEIVTLAKTVATRMIFSLPRLAFRALLEAHGDKLGFYALRIVLNSR